MEGNTYKVIKATAIYNDGKNNYQVNYHGSKSKVISNFKADMESRNTVWGRLFDVDTADCIWKKVINFDDISLPDCNETVRCTAIYHDGKNNYQTNYGGIFGEIHKDFQKDMARRDVEWAVLLCEKTGDLWGMCNKPASIENKEASGTKTVTYSSTIPYTKSELESIISEVCGEEYMKHTAMPKALEKAAVLMWMEGEGMTDRACMVRSALKDLYHGEGYLNYA